jgi:hypothetical protein
MTDHPGCEHQWDGEPECARAWRNYYRCADCGAHWNMEWSCQCDDDCPDCGATMTPARSEEIAPCACRYFSAGVGAYSRPVPQ